MNTTRLITTDNSVASRRSTTSTQPMISSSSVEEYSRGDSAPSTTSRKTHGPDYDDDDVTVPSMVSRSGERSVQTPARCHVDILHEDPATKSLETKEKAMKFQQEENPRRGRGGTRKTDSADVALAPPKHEGSDLWDEYGRDETAGAQDGASRATDRTGKRANRLELASLVEPPNADVPGDPPTHAVRREDYDIDGSGNQLHVQPADNNDVRHHHLSNLTTAAPPPTTYQHRSDSNAGDQRPTFPGAVHVPGPRAGAGNGRVDYNSNSAVRAAEVADDDIFSAQLVDPEDEQGQLQRNVEQIIDARFAQQIAGDNTSGTDDDCCVVQCKVCGIDFSKRSNQVLAIVIFVMAAVLAVLAALLVRSTNGPAPPSAAAVGSATPSPTFQNQNEMSSSPSQGSSSPSTFSPAGNVVPTFTGRPSHPLANTTPPSTPPLPTMPPTMQPTPRPNTPAPVNSAPVAPSVSNHPSAFVAQWVQLGNDVNGAAARDESGYSAALSSNGTVLAIGARNNDAGGSNSGHARVYTFAGGEWIQLGNDLNGTAANDLFGNSLSLSGDGTTLAVGAPQHDGVRGSNSGQVRVFGWNGASWQPRGTPLEGEIIGDTFGENVAVQGKIPTDIDTQALKLVAICFRSLQRHRKMIQ